MEFLCTYVATKGMDSIINFISNKFGNESLEYELITALEDSLCDTCNYFAWEYDANAIIDIFVISWINIKNIDTINNLKVVLEKAVGKEIDDEILEYWIFSFHKQITNPKRNWLNQFILINHLFDNSSSTDCIENYSENLQSNKNVGLNTSLAIKRLTGSIVKNNFIKTKEIYEFQHSNSMNQEESILDNKNMDSNGLYGLSFTLLSSPNIITRVFEIRKMALPLKNKWAYVPILVDQMSETDKELNRKDTFFLDYVHKNMNLAILNFDTLEHKVYMNMGILDNNEILISKGSAMVQLNEYPVVENNFIYELIDLTEYDEEDYKYITDFDPPLVVMDSTNGEIIKPRINRGKDGIFYGKIRLRPYRNYVVLFIKDKFVEKDYSLNDYEIGYAYKTGTYGLKKNMFKAKCYFEKGIKENDMNAHYELANLYKEGIGCEKNIKKAIELYSKAARNGHDKAKYELKYFQEKN